MDGIQKFLVTAGRKDLAQEYYLKTTIHLANLKTKVVELTKNIPEYKFWKESTDILSKLENLTNNLNKGVLWDFLFKKSMYGVEQVLADEEIFEKYPTAKVAYKKAMWNIDGEIVTKMFGVEYSGKPTSAYKYLLKHFPTSKEKLLIIAKEFGDDEDLNKYVSAVEKYFNKV